ncbi:MAG: tRNA (guanosine(46)-N7)-methyltransferase TrmB [Alphaproteobacteria bacterium]|nr:tRNA (guanosine(46)-N7)-methyltransferase TrmB [Alphaproteobacteria bacterium]MBT4710552.1 tRNA (guanosine(46)-N7)-methyltransferase TrmB [Alphaproteobacteria bacterium]
MSTKMTDQRPPRGFFGRRHGHRLRAGRQALIDDLLPGLAVDVNPAVSLDPATLFPPEAFRPIVHPPEAFRPEVWLEIGFGGGEHLAALAQANPDVGFIGCERFINGIASLLSHIQAADIGNIRIADADAQDLLNALTPASIDRLFLLFPDPWPKTRHHKRRFVNQGNLDNMARVLTDGAQVRFASDHSEYCDWTLERFLDHKDFTWVAEHPDDWRVRPDDWPQTRYEATALAKALDISYFTFQRVVRAITAR